MRQLAGRSVMSELEHKENKSRVRSGPRREKIILVDGQRCRNQAGPFVLNPASVWSSTRHGPPRELERFPASFPRHLSGSALSGHVGIRKGLVQPTQSEDRP